MPRKTARNWIGKINMKAGAFTAQARRAGYQDTLAYARHVLRENELAERKGHRRPFTKRTQRRAQLALNMQARKGNARR